jgi:hypothetical protein
MEQGTKDIMNAFLVELLDGVKKAGAFVSEQLPIVLKEYILWGIVSNTIWAVVMLAGCYVMYRGFKMFFDKKWYLESPDRNGHREVSPGIMLMVFPAFGFVFLAIEAVSRTLTALKAIFAPRVYLIDELGKLIH